MTMFPKTGCVLCVARGHGLRPSVLAGVLGLMSAAVWAQGLGDSVSSERVRVTAPVTGLTQADGFAGSLAAGKTSAALASGPVLQVSPAQQQTLAATYQVLLPPALREAGLTQPQSVLGVDRRFQIDPVLSGYPYRAVGQITFQQNGGSYICTAWLISADTVATAGHCVHAGDGSVRGWSSNVVFHPGRMASSSPFGTCNGRLLYTTQGWRRDGLPQYDYGAIKLDCQIGQSVGWIGRQVYEDARASVMVLGYPGDKTFGTLWGGAGEVAASSSRQTSYRIDTAGGQSGGAVLRSDGARNADCQGACALAIHAYGVSASGTNSGTRITAEVFDNLQYWIDTP